MAVSVDVVIPVYGGWPQTERCLRALAAQTIPHRVVVVDNASPDDTVERLRADFPGVRCIEMGANAGYGRAANAGAAGGAGELVVVLNNDVYPEPDFLERLAEGFADPRAGSAAPLLLRPGSTEIDAFGVAVDRTLAGFLRFQGSPVEAVEHVTDGAAATIGPYGAAAAYRRTAFEGVGGFDERIFMYGEELDLALRLRAAGWACTEVRAARAVHEGGATAGKRSRFQRMHGGFGRGYLLRRYGILRSRAAAVTLLTELIVILGDLAISRDTAALRGRVAGWRAARRLPTRRLPGELVADQVGFRASLHLRLADYGLVSRG